MSTAEQSKVGFANPFFWIRESQRFIMHGGGIL